MDPLLKPVEWISGSRDDLRQFPEDVQQMVGFPLYRAQLGKKHPDAKPLRLSSSYGNNLKLSFSKLFSSGGFTLMLAMRRSS
jgi:phage-related protein